MRRLYALYGILSPFPQRPLCVVGRGWGEGKMKCGGGGVGERISSSHLPLCACYFYFLITIFDQLSILSRVVNSISCYVSQLLCQVFIGQNSLVRTSSWQKKFLCKVFFDNNDRRNIKLKTRQIRGGRRSYVK